MREIKFRGQRRKSPDWVYGGVDHYNTDTVTVDGCIVAKETIGQYTGFRDKNNTEIYEGDIVRTTYEEEREFNGVRYAQKMHFIEQVKWVDEDAGFFLLIYIEGIPMYRRMTLGSDYGKTRLVSIEVIGNIHDNPELLFSLFGNEGGKQI